MSKTIEWTVRLAEHARLGPTFQIVELHVESGNTGAIVAQLHPSVHGVQNLHKASAIVEQRATLMASAPALLAALEGLLNAPLGGLSGEEFERRAAARDVARAAIVKTGVR